MIQELEFFLHQIDQWVDGLDRVEKGLVIYFIILLFLWVWKSDEKPEETRVKPDERRSKNGDTRTIEPVSFIFRPKPKLKLAVNKTAFIREVVSWGMRNIVYEGVSQKRNSVGVEISYHPHKKLHGVFYSCQKKIRIYVNNHAKVEDLVDTSLHEVVHLLQYTADKKNFQKRYNKLLQEKTYSKHPMEIEAVKLAAQYSEPCLNYLIAQGKLMKVG